MERLNPDFFLYDYLRPKFPKELRRQILDEADYTCEDCGLQFRKRNGGKGPQGVEVHHKLPHAIGGKDDKVNAVVLCGPEGRDCHERADRRAMDRGILYDGIPLEDCPPELIGDRQRYRRALRNRGRG